jgi:hypothetical protein
MVKFDHFFTYIIGMARRALAGEAEQAWRDAYLSTVLHPRQSTVHGAAPHDVCARCCTPDRALKDAYRLVAPFHHWLSITGRALLAYSQQD